jgi:hypothetical protein
MDKMSQNGSKIAYFRHEINSKYIEDIRSGTALSSETIRKEVMNGPFPFSDQELEDIVLALESIFTTTQARGSAVKSDYKPWLAERTIDYYYWSRLHSYYLDGGVLPPSVVSTLNTVTDEVLDFCGNPEDEGSWKRRGMVLGHVQSGKTTNYSSLICKAADAGYKVIILLAGITNSLRTQTQERLDETFIGKKSVFQAAAAEDMPILAYSHSQETRFPAYGTSRDRDFSKAAASTYGVSLSALKEPIIFVTKKNKATLERLRDWLREQNHGHYIHDPLLMIDDEADNASINTASEPNRVTAINKVIREILAMFDRTSYVGYTATPFANIFIDPDTNDEMLEDGLFPKHFIKALEPPSNYVGATRVFNPEGNLRKTMVRLIDDYSDTLPLKHKRDEFVATLPGSMYKAVQVFFLSRAIRILRKQDRKHCSMMINVSRFNDVQEKVLGHIYHYKNVLFNAIEVNSGLGKHAFKDYNIRDLALAFEEEYGDIEFSFSDILRVLPEAVSSIIVMTVNMRGGLLDYSKHKAKGLHVIAIGGLALSRGLTLEGLTVSYILRNTVASDTLMQMARWFGYRPEYEDICRLYLPQSSLDHYEYIDEATEELRGEVKRMDQLGLTPADFGLRVRESPTAIRITAANKMQTASTLVLAQDYSKRRIEGFVIRNNQTVNIENLELVEAFLKDAELLSEVEDGNEETKLWERAVKGNDVLSLIKRFDFPEAHTDLGEISKGVSLFSDYVSDRIHEEGDLKVWDVCLPFSSTAKEETLIFGKPCKLRERKHGDIQSKNYRVTGGKNRIEDPKDKNLGLQDTEERVRPLLIIHAFRPGLTDGSSNLEISAPAISLSFHLPETGIKPKVRVYQVNSVYRQQLEAIKSEPDDDEQFIGNNDDN